MPQNEVSKMLGSVWAVFGAFAITLSVIAIFLVPMRVSLIIVIIMGLAECMSGVLLKNWPIIIGGFILAVQVAYVSQVRSAPSFRTPAGGDEHPGRSG